GDPVGEGPDAAANDVVQAGGADHGLRGRRPVPTLGAGSGASASAHPPVALTQQRKDLVGPSGPVAQVRVPPLLVQEHLPAEAPLEHVPGRGRRGLQAVERIGQRVVTIGGRWVSGTVRGARHGGDGALRRWPAPTTPTPAVSSSVPASTSRRRGSTSRSPPRAAPAASTPTGPAPGSS